MTEKSYKNIEKFFSNHCFLLKLLKFLYKYLPLAVIFTYLPFAFYYTLDLINSNFKYFWKIGAVPAIVFLVVTVFRKVYNSERPYEKYNITPLVKKDKKGHSFPSRHVASGFIIAMALLYANTFLGIIFTAISLIIAVTRVLAGVHFIKDVVVGGIFSIVTGILFIFLV